MEDPKTKPTQGTLPGMVRRHEIRRPCTRGRHEVKPYRIELDPELDAAAGLAAELEAEPPADTARRCREPYDDSARGFVGLPHAKTATSKAAAERMLPRAGAQRRRVYEYIHEQGGHGATPDEVAAALEIPTTSAGPRFYELRGAGLIERTADTRKTRAGATARVHITVPGMAPVPSRYPRQGLDR